MHGSGWFGWAALAALAVGCSDAAPAAPAATDSGGTTNFATDATKFVDTKGKDSSAKPDAAPETLESETSEDAELETAAADAVVADAIAIPDTTEPPADVSPAACVPQCAGKTCGTDGCGGNCGGCTDKELCQVGKCAPKPNLGCAGLALKENWTGKFKGDCTFVAAGGLLPIAAKTSGDMAFAIKCFNSKYLVNGKMDGEASGNKFTLTIGGTYDPAKGLLTGTLSNGEILLWKVFTYKFEGPIEGTLSATGTFDGTWKVESTDVKFLGQPSPTTPPFKANGTWSATGT